MTEGQVFGGRYRVDEVIGEGGMARVYRAGDLRLGRTVALKVLREGFASEREFVDRFEQEARLAAGLTHPNIVGVYDVGMDHDLHYIVMEYVEGENLKTVIARAAPMPPAEMLPLARGLAAALDYAHEHGVVHRDIKPENILLTGRGEVKVSDFGIARALSSSTLTATGTVLGSVSYFSPEQASGQPAVAESDLYSMAIVIYELLTRRVPFANPNPVAVAMAQVNDPPPPLRSVVTDLPAPLDSVIMKALAKNPAARYHSGAALVAALTDASKYAGRGRVAKGAASAPTVRNAPIASGRGPSGVTPAAAFASAGPRPIAPRRAGSGGALAALLTTAILLIAAVLVARNLTGSTADDATATPTRQIGATGPTPLAGISTPTPPPGTTSEPAVDTPVPGTATPGAGGTNPPATATGQAPVVAPVPSDTQPPPIATKVTPSATGTAPPLPSLRPSATASSPSPTAVHGSVGTITASLVTSTAVASGTAIGVTGSFPAKAGTIYAFARFQGKPAGVSLVFRWRYPDGTGFSYTNTYVAPYSDSYGYAELIPRGPGSYAVSVLVRGHIIAKTSFTVGG